MSDKKYDWIGKGNEIGMLYTDMMVSALRSGNVYKFTQLLNHHNDVCEFIITLKNTFAAMEDVEPLADHE